MVGVSFLVEGFVSLLLALLLSHLNTQILVGLLIFDIPLSLNLLFPSVLL